MGLFLAASAGAALLVLSAAFFRSETPPIMPPETPEEEGMRTASENAYPVLDEAVRLVPPPPSQHFIEEADESGYVGPYIPSEDSVALMLGVGRPDDDPEFVTYLQSTEAAVAKMREAIARPYFRLPTPEHWNYPGVWLGSEALAKLAVAHAVYAVRYESAAVDPSAVIDSMRLGELVAQDGGFHGFRVGVQIQGLALKYAWNAALGPANAADRPAILEALSHHALSGRSLRAPLEYEWRIVDRPDAMWILMQRPDRAQRGDEGLENFVQRMLLGRQLDALRRHILANRESYLHSVDLSLPDLQAWQNRHPEVFHGRVWFDLMHRILPAREQSAQLDAWLCGWMVRVELEAFHARRGAYPESLSDLGVDVTDPIAGEPFRYRVFPEDFTLYSVGANGDDNNGDPWKERDLVFHRATEEPPTPEQTLATMGVSRFGRRGEAD